MMEAELSLRIAGIALINRVVEKNALLCTGDDCGQCALRRSLLLIPLDVNTLIKITEDLMEFIYPYKRNLTSVRRRAALGYIVSKGQCQVKAICVKRNNLLKNGGTDYAMLGNLHELLLNLDGDAKDLQCLHCDQRIAGCSCLVTSVGKFMRFGVSSGSASIRVLASQMNWCRRCPLSAPEALDDPTDAGAIEPKSLTFSERKAMVQRCFRCGAGDHLKSMCPLRPEAGRCFSCGQTGHIQHTCPLGGLVCRICNRRGHAESGCLRRAAVTVTAVMAPPRGQAAVGRTPSDTESGDCEGGRPAQRTELAIVAQMQAPQQGAVVATAAPPIDARVVQTLPGPASLAVCQNIMGSSNCKWLRRGLQEHSDRNTERGLQDAADSAALPTDTRASALAAAHTGIADLARPLPRRFPEPWSGKCDLGLQLKAPVTD